MSVQNDVAEQNIITITDEEYDFFESFTKKYSISWTYEEKKSRILPLSKAYVGYINTPLRVISLKPKYDEIGFEHILRMYLYVYGYRKSDSAAVLDVSESDNRIDIAELFMKNLRKNVQEGINRVYRKKSLQSASLKGRVDFTKTFRNKLLQKRNYAVSQATVLSLDTPINNLIYSALVKLQHTQSFSVESRELSMYFVGAQSVVKEGSKALSSIRFNSNTARYRKTLIYAAMIIDQMTYNDVGSVIGTDSFLINFDRLFEDFVAKVLKEVPEKKEFSTWASKRQFAKVMNDNGYFESREYQPDIIYKFSVEDARFDYTPSAYAVLDVKNKAYGQFKNADIYQMLTYTRLLHAEKAMLLYPSFYKRKAETLALDPNLFTPSIITACFVNIADENGEDFLKSIEWFANVVVNKLLNIPA